MVGRRALARLLDVGTPVLVIFVGAPALVVLAAYWAYETALTARSGQTFGKQLAAVRAVTAEGRPPGLARAAVRALPILLLAVPYAWVLCPLAYLVAVGPSRRGLHDLAAGTHIVGERWMRGEQVSR